MKILVDLDGTVVDMIGPLIKLHNALVGPKGRHMTISDVLTYDIPTSFPETYRELWNEITRIGFFEHLKALPGAIEALKKISEQHEVFIVSSPTACTGAASEKASWVQYHAPFIDRFHVIWTSAKEMIRGDMLIDDHPAQLRKYRAAWPNASLVTLAYPYTEAPDPPVYPFVYGVVGGDPAEAWRVLEQDILGGAFEP